MIVGGTKESNDWFVVPSKLEIRTFEDGDFPKGTHDLDPKQHAKS